MCSRSLVSYRLGSRGNQIPYDGSEKVTPVFRELVEGVRFAFVQQPTMLLLILTAAL